MRIAAAFLIVAIVSGGEAAAQTAASRPLVPPASIGAAAGSDSILNGMLIGIGAGIAATVIFTTVNCGTTDSECAAIAGPVGAVIFIPAGALLGALIDRQIGNDRVSIVPRVDRRARGVAIRLRF